MVSQSTEVYNIAVDVYLLRDERGRYNTETCIPHVSEPEEVLDKDEKSLC